MTDEAFRALADPTRREILRLLRTRDMSAGEISEHFSSARSTLTRHCDVLKAAGLIISERQGSRVVYSLNLSVYEEVVGAVVEALGIGFRGSRVFIKRSTNRGGVDAYELSD